MLKIKKDEWKKLAALSNRIDRQLRNKYAAPTKGPNRFRNQILKKENQMLKLTSHFGAIRSKIKNPVRFFSASTMDTKRVDELIRANQLSMTTWAKQSGASHPLMVGAEGCYTIDSSGRKVLDIFASQMSVNLGYNRQDTNLARYEQGQTISPARPQVYTEVRGIVSQKLVDLCQMDKIYYTNTGAEGVEKAIIMARQIKGLPNGLVMSRDPSYHGATGMALSCSGDVRQRMRGEVPGHVRVADAPEGYGAPIRGQKPSDPIDSSVAVAIWEEQILKHGPENIVAILVEGRSCSAGVYVYDNQYLTRMQALAKKYELVFIVDEVASGFWRTGPAMSTMHEDVKPDLMVLGKGMVNGEVPGGAVMLGSMPAKFFEDNMLICGSTNYACPLMLATSKASLEAYEREDIPSQVMKSEKILARKLNELWDKHECVTDVRHNGGLVAAVDVDGGKDFVGMQMMIQKTLDENLVQTWVRPEKGVARIFIVPPLVISEEQLDFAFDVISDKACASAERRLAGEK